LKGKKIRRLVFFLLILGGVGAGLYYYRHQGVQTDDTLKLYGNVDIRQIQLAFHATGRIQRLLVQEGDRVKAGQLVAELDPSRYADAVAQARGRVASQQQVLARLLAGSRPEEIAASRARVAAAQATLRDAEQTNRRSQALVAKDLISRQEADNAEAAFKSAQADLDAAQQQLDLSILGPREEDIAAARAQLKAEEAALALAQKELADTRLYSPTSAVVQNRVLEVGDMVSPQTPVYTLALSQPLWVRAYVSEPDLGKIHPGMHADVSTDSFPGKLYRGWIGFISPTAEFTPKEVQTPDLRSRLVYQIRVYVCAPQNELRLGMPATVSIPLKQSAPSPASEPCTEK
jgi:HlyD family secretion protein